MAETGNRTQTWYNRYDRKRADLYPVEDRNRLEWDQGDKAGLIKEFLNVGTIVELDPPIDFRHSLLQAFLNAGDIHILAADTLNGNHERGRMAGTNTDFIMMDDRQDATGTHVSTRVWDSPGKGGYLDYPPEGTSIFTHIMSMREFFKRLNGNRQAQQADKRIIFCPGLSPTGALVLAGTASKRIAPSLRDFLSQYLLCRAYFRISLDAIFRLEFHIPYYALRRDGRPYQGDIILNGERQKLRKCKLLPLSTPGSYDKDYHYYEANVSLLVTGIDEWFWQAYCLIDSYFSPKYNPKRHFERPKWVDPCTGTRPLEFPHWNPREFFLAVLSARLDQATREWRALIDTFDGRMSAYVRLLSLDFII
ncbi:hypothetical protein NA57DRAFT_81756 [Rhizodiscina lignyota]|uniref:Uncharacterized protein n=1 Tax=Rhizodiscina lignyota TaxID=1504668 RepID=A0A9P4I5I7_9PEZI|nr:hypothetical protein NA57DRAFT_81756 [Rhizodiscina lignyota]